MYRGSSRIVPALLIVAAVVVAIVALVAVGRAILGGDTQVPPAEDPARRRLLTTDADHSVRMTVRGPIVADENFYSYTVTVSPTGRRMTTYSGYQEQQLENYQFSNSTKAYTEFVNALDAEGFTKQDDAPEEQESTDGICADGRLYTFEVMVAQSAVQQLWTSSCKNAPGTFKGNAPAVRTLFLRQIPDSATHLRAIDLSV